MQEIYLLDKDLWFPPVINALEEPNGLLAVGGDLSPERLRLAYRLGIFPWFNAEDPILWWSPSPRMVLFPSAIKISRSLNKRLRRGDFKVTFNQDFAQVIEQCALVRALGEGTWITAQMQSAYQRLHQEGYAHSIEVWKDARLVGGLYGVALGSIFFGESMFSHVSDASKVALVTLAQRLEALNFTLIDCQVYSLHLASLGAKEISRDDFLNLLEQGVQGDQQSFR